MIREVDVLLVGGGAASVRCARTLRRHGFAGTILLVGDERRMPYNRPPLSKELLRGEAPEELTAVEPAEWYLRHRVDLLTDVAVTELHPGERLVRINDGSSIRFGRCLLATGARPRRPPVPGTEHAQTLRTLDDAGEIQARARAGGRDAPAVVIGGGFIGVEVAASLAALGLRPTVLEASNELWAGTLGPVVSGWAVERLADGGVAVRLAAAASGLEAGGAWVGTERLPAALLVVGVGVTPRVELAEKAGLDVDDGIVINAAREAATGIFAAGDVARLPHPLAEGALIRVEHWHAAREGGEAAALSILGERVPVPRAPWVFSEFAGQSLDVVGWAPDRDEERVLGDPSSNRFAVAYLRSDRVAQLAIANAFLRVEAARTFVESRPTADALATLLASTSTALAREV